MSEKELTLEAKNLLGKAAVIYEETKDRKLAASIYEVLENKTKAQELYREVAQKYLRKGTLIDRSLAAEYFEHAGDLEKKEQLLKEVIQECEIEGDKDYTAHLFEKLGDEEKAKQLYLEIAREAEEEMPLVQAQFDACQDEQEKKELGSRLYRLKEDLEHGYQKAGANDDYKRVLQTRLQKCKQQIDNPFDYFTIAEYAEKLGFKDEAQKNYLKYAKFLEKVFVVEMGAEFKYLMLKVVGYYYARGGDTTKAKEIWRVSAQMAEEQDVKDYAVGAYKGIKESVEAERILNEIINEARSENDKMKLADNLVSLWNLTQNENLLVEAKQLYLEFAQENENSEEKKKKEDAAWAYRKVVYILCENPLPIVSHFEEFYAKHFVP